MGSPENGEAQDRANDPGPQMSGPPTSPVQRNRDGAGAASSATNRDVDRATPVLLGPPMFPMPKKVKAWPGDGWRDWSAVSDALTRRHDFDAFVQGVEWPGSAAAPRLKKKGLAAFCADNGMDLLAPGAPRYARLQIDIDNAGHAPWSSTAAAASAVEDLYRRTASTGFGWCIYATRGGLRGMVRLAVPLDLLHAQSYLDQLYSHPNGLRAILGEDLFAGLDTGCVDWTRLMRLPWVARLNPDGTPADPAPWGDNMPPIAGLDGFLSGAAVFEWTAPEPLSIATSRKGRVRATRTSAPTDRPADPGNAPTDRPADPGKPPPRWYSRVRHGFARKSLDDIRNARPLRKPDGVIATHNGLVPIVASLAAQVEYPTPAALYAILLPSLVAGGVDLDDAWNLIAHVADNEAEDRETPDEDADLDEPSVELDRGESGGVKPTLANTIVILRAEWGARIRLNQLTGDVEVEGTPLSETRITGLAEWVALNHRGCDVARDTVFRAAEAVAERNAYHPIRTWLRSLEWDGVPRLDRFAADYLRAEGPPELVSAIGRCTVIALVARALRPGCQVDTVTVLFGPQGTFKSTGIRNLVEGPADGPHRGWYSDEEIPWDDEKRRGPILRRVWGLEMQEVRQFRQREAEAQKALITKREERYVPMYGRAVVVEPRGFVLFGTANPEDGPFLLDPGRRWWVLTIGRATDRAAILRDRDQLFAEAVARFDAGEEWHLSEALDAVRATETQQHAIVDELRDHVGSWWEGVPSTRPADGSAFFRAVVKVDAVNGLTLDTIATDVLGRGIGALPMADQRRLGRALRDNGWAKDQRSKRWHPPVPVVCP